MPYNNKNTQNEYQKAWIKERRANFFKSKKCCWCGSTKNLQLHHIDPKEKETHNIWSWSKARQEKEISKCIVLCQHCHTNFHAENTRKPLIHGTMNAYAKKGCRCQQCKTANAKKSARRRELIRDVKIHNV